MNRFALLLSAIVISAAVIGGCSGGNGPISPSAAVALSQGSSANGPASEHLWGYYDVYIDVASQTAVASPNRQAMFTANVVNFLNGKPAGLGFKINGTSPGADYIDVDIEVSITHPFPGMPQYNGYDVRGVFMGDGSASMSYNPALIYPVSGTDQMMLADPSDGFGGPDGYTRWFNPAEFSEGGMPLFQYTKGNAASAGFAGTATLNAYKYFADGLGATEDLWTWLGAHTGQHGVFSSGATNTRNYYLCFPNAKGVKYGYAIIANWIGTEPESHPANCPEAVAADVADSSNVYYVDPSYKGGNLVLDISLFGWHGEPTGIYIESTVLSNVHQLTPSEMVPVGGNENYSTWHVEIPADNVTGLDGNEYWVIAQYSNSDYSNEFGTPNLAQDDPLAALFRYNLPVTSNPSNENPVCDLQVLTPLPAKGWDAGTPVEFDASGSTDPDGDALHFAWDFDGDGTYGENPDDSFTGAAAKPTHYYTADFDGQACVKVTDGKGGESICCVDVQVDTFPSKNIPLRDGVEAFDIAINSSNGDLLVIYADGQIWKYLIADFYQSGSELHDLSIDWAFQNLAGLRWMDVAPNNAIAVTGISYNLSQNRLAFYMPDGSPCTTSIWPGSSFNIFDAFMFGESGTFANDGGFAFGYEWNGGHYTQIERHAATENYGTVHFMSYIFYGTVYTGPEKVYGPYCVATETDKTGDYIWFLENTDWYASRWVSEGSGIYGNLTYDKAYFGTGSQTDSDNGWYNAKDLCRDNQNRYFVLDLLSTNQPRIKMWTVNGNTTTSKGGFGNSTSIAGPPLRIEGSDFGGEVVVLHGSSAPYMISVFIPFEMPG